MRGGVAVVAAALCAYAGTFQVPFVFDDVASIVDNPTIRQLWPLSIPLSPPTDWGFTVSGRPVLNLSLAINYAVSGVNVWSYHAVNLVIHALAGLTLLGLARRTLVRDVLPLRIQRHAGALALIIASLWTLHPLQTESLTYVIQRAESLMGLFVLLTLYAFVRGTDSPRPWRWWVVAIGACLLGMGTKEVTAIAPLLVLLYDRTFLSGTFGAAWRRHGRAHVALAGCWLPLAWLVMSTGGDRGGTMGFDGAESAAGYWLIQFEAVTRYLGLALWPAPLVFDYGKIPPPSVGTALTWAGPVVLGLVVTAVALRRWPVAGFLGAWFFLLLAPTSVVPGALQMIVEHRLYLPLAAVVALLSAGLTLVVSWRTCVVTSMAIALALGGLTVRRNADYADAETIWRDTLVKRPDNARAHNNLGLALYGRGSLAEAIAHYRASVRLDPGSAQTHYNLGLALMRAGQTADAEGPLRAAVERLPYFFNAHLNLGIVLMSLGRPAEALAPLAIAIQFDPAPAEAHFRRGLALASLGRWNEAIADYDATTRLNPAHAGAHNNRGVALTRLGRPTEAIAHFEAALRLPSAAADVHFNLGQALAALSRPADAVRQFQEAVRLDPRHAEAHLALGVALGMAGQLEQAIATLRRAAELAPEAAAVHTNLGTALATANRFAEALAHYEHAARLLPADAQAQYNVGYALLATGRAAEAVARLEAALRIRPDFPAAQRLLQEARAARR